MDETLTMAALKVGESGYVTRLSAPPAMERRLKDLGLVRGTRVTCMVKSPAGDPCAYLIRGALIALRRADAAGIRLERALPAAVSGGRGPASPWWATPMWANPPCSMP